MKNTLAVIGLVMALIVPGVASATIIISNTTNGYYNQSLGTILDKTSADFPGANSSTGDPVMNNISPAPNLSAASLILGNWLSNPQNLNSYWSPAPVAVPLTWPVNTESAIIYKINAGATGLKNVIARFGVDNGIYVWLDGNYLNGWIAPGKIESYNEYAQNIGSLSSGNHYLQIIREDHGVANGYAVNVTGEQAPDPVPDPGTLILLGAGAAGLVVFGKRRQYAKR